jgi:hypothetical protein
MSDLVGEVERIPRKPRITQEKISKTHEGRKWKNVNIEQGRKNCIKLRNEKNRDIDMAKKEYLESICDEITTFLKTERYDMQSKELGRRENHGFQNIDVEGSKANVIVDQTSTENLEELYYRALRSS